MKCPICDNEIQDYTEDYMEHILMEEHATCQDDNHFYQLEYVTGNTREMIGDVSIYSHHVDTKVERELKGQKFRAVLELEREHYQRKSNEQSD
jgi:hypothetical protein